MVEPQVNHVEPWLWTLTLDPRCNAGKQTAERLKRSVLPIPIGIGRQLGVQRIRRKGRQDRPAHALGVGHPHRARCVGRCEVPVDG
jgi:hypothetical protein